MKIQLDTQNKTIKVENSVKFSELIDVLNKLFPKNEWENYTLETSTVINNWSSPIIIDRYKPFPYYPSWYTGSGIPQLSSGNSEYSNKVYNLEAN